MYPRGIRRAVEITGEEFPEEFVEQVEKLCEGSPRWKTRIFMGTPKTEDNQLLEMFMSKEDPHSHILISAEIWEPEDSKCTQEIADEITAMVIEAAQARGLGAFVASQVVPGDPTMFTRGDDKTD